MVGKSGKEIVTAIIYDFVFGHEHGRPGIVWINRPGLVGGRYRPGPYPHPLGLWSGEGSGFPPDMEEPPIIVLDPAIGRVPITDSEGLGGTFYLISEAAKNIFERLDPQAFIFCKVEMRHASGARYDGPDYWLCDIPRFLDAVDEAKSGVKPSTVGGVKWTEFPLGGDAVFRRDVIGGHHIFRLMYRPSFVGCDEALRSAIEDANLKGFWFYRTGVLDG